MLAGMQENPLKLLWEREQTAFGVWLAGAGSIQAEILARQGFDYVVIDLQHGFIDDVGALPMLQAIGLTPSVPLVRVCANDFASINRALDFGALGVIVPMVNSAADAHAAVRACRYAPAGARSFAPSRGSLADPDYVAQANERVLCIPMIETREALDALPEILSVPGVDAIYVGPNDLSMTLGLGPGNDNPGAAFQEAQQRIARTCAAHGVVAGIHGSAEIAAKRQATGYRMITISTDLGSLAAGAQRDLALARG
jgi:4-hydroxy-2-oxoheptanedioate aldolase